MPITKNQLSILCKEALVESITNKLLYLWQFTSRNFFCNPGLLYILILAVLVYAPPNDNPYIYFYVAEIVLLVLSAHLKSKHLYYCCVGLAILFSGLRHKVGVDFQSYLALFDQVREADLVSWSEPMTSLIVLATEQIGLGNGAIFFIYSAITIIGIVKFLDILPQIKLHAFFLFLSLPILYLSSFNGIRQWAAIGLSGFIISYIVNGKKSKMWTALALAPAFHFSAFILPVFLFLRKQYSFKTILVFSVIALVIGDLITIIINYTPYAIYAREDGIRFEGGSYNALAFYSLILIVLPYKLGYFTRSLQLSASVIVLCNMNIVSFLWIIASSVAGLDFLSLMRVNAFFTIQLTILLPLAANSLKGINKLLAHIGLMSFSLLYLIYTLMINGVNYSLTPYKTIIFAA